MATLVFTFPAGRYHATPSGNHVNEGLVEWPPSPWRVVRALLACGFATQGWEQVPPAGRRLIGALCAVLPEYRLPPAALGHSRHYMPTAVLDKGREKTTLVLDSFADVGRGELWLRWPTALDPEAGALLRRLVENLGYLGRSESWVVGRLVDDSAPMPHVGRAFPHVEGERPSRGFEQISLVAPELPERYASWRDQEVQLAAQELGLVGEGKMKPTQAQLKKRKVLEEGYPADLLECLQLDTAWWKHRRWSQPPGSRRVVYWREATALEVAPPVAPRRPVTAPVAAVLLALTTPSGSRSALPTVARTLPQAELLHKALVSKVGFEAGVECPELSGRDAEGRPLKGHRHAHHLPLDLDQDGHLDHIVVFAPMGLGAAAQRAIRSLKRTYTKGGVGELQLAIAGQGRLEDLRSLGGNLSRSVQRLLAPPGGATTWTSSTPYVPPRHLKNRGRNTLEGQVLTELDARGLGSATVEVLPWTPQLLPLRHFIRRRRAPAPQPAVDVAFALRIHFERPVSGPITLGYGCHFGLGRFDADA